MTLKIAILESGRSQIDIAKDADLHESKLSRIINGHDEATDAERKALARVLRRKATQLFPQAESAA